MYLVGTAGWSIPRDYSGSFPEEGSHLSRYSRVFNCVEINSSFYREHLPRTYERWAGEVPEDFLFSVKLSQEFTHHSGLKPAAKEIRQSLENIRHLGNKLGMILLQFPGSLEFERKKFERFLTLIRKTYEGPLSLEARNCSWVGTDARSLYYDFGVSKVAADPERCEGGPKKLLTSGGAAYYRLHGTPVIYRSSYPKKYLKELASELSVRKKSWVIFDNTTFGKATENALFLRKLL